MRSRVVQVLDHPSCTDREEMLVGKIRYVINVWQEVDRRRFVKELGTSRDTCE